VLAARAHAFLAGSCTRIWPLFLAQESPLELHHARVGKKKAWVVVRNYRRAFNNRMSTLIEKLEEGLSYLAGFHQCNLLTF
jgi:hypothetical protein